MSPGAEIQSGKVVVDDAARSILVTQLADIVKPTTVPTRKAENS
jgi:hypothetical protein